VRNIAESAASPLEFTRFGKPPVWQELTVIAPFTARQERLKRLLGRLRVGQSERAAGAKLIA
jgi:hypothetical protein